MRERMTDEKLEHILSSGPSGKNCDCHCCRLGEEVQDRRAAEKELLERLAPIYQWNPLAVARVCDEALDRSGALLGRLRDVAAGLK